MDVHCRHCGEPIDTDEFHDAGFPSYEDAAAAFAKFGCGFWDRRTCTSAVVDPRAAEEAGVLQELTPHPDEWASLHGGLV